MMNKFLSSLAIVFLCSAQFVVCDFAYVDLYHRGDFLGEYAFNKNEVRQTYGVEAGDDILMFDMANRDGQRTFQLKKIAGNGYEVLLDLGWMVNVGQSDGLDVSMNDFRVVIWNERRFPSPQHASAQDLQEYNEIDTEYHQTEEKEKQKCESIEKQEDEQRNIAIKQADAKRKKTQQQATRDKRAAGNKIGDAKTEADRQIALTIYDKERARLDRKYFDAHDISDVEKNAANERRDKNREIARKDKEKKIEEAREKRDKAVAQLFAQCQARIQAKQSEGGGGEDEKL